MKRIKLLPENLINQIAAGEVIERPASVVKELVENSIDAGASKIEIEISNTCRNIRVADNGSGINEEDVTLAFSRHATSKISEQKDLWSISTLGFRGEALASIISVSKVTCTTKTENSEAGVKVECENSEINMSEVGCAKGTIMEVRDLFYNIPARLKFLKKTHTELSAISETVQNIALANPAVAINLINNKNSILKTTGSNGLVTAIGEIYSKNIINEFCEVFKEDPQFRLKITGYASNPDFVRSNKKAIYTFINGRAVKCPILLKAIDTAYSDMIPSGKHPYVVLNLSIPHKNLDVNVHPAKREVKYTNTNLIFNFIYSSIKAALDNTVSSIQQPFEQPENTAFQPGVQNREISFEQPETLDFTTYSKQREPQNTFEFAEIDKNGIQEAATQAPVQSSFGLGESQEVFRDKPRIIGQLDNTYILIQTDGGLQIVDQHIAHERYLYEKLKEQSSPASQMLLASELINLDPEQVSLLQENGSVLAKYGYELDYVPAEGYSKTTSDNAVALQAPIDSKTGLNRNIGARFKRVPNIVAQKDPKKLIDDLLKAFESSPDTIEDELLIRTACRAAVKAGERLSVSQMEELIIDWQKTKYSKTCPHGRKISHVIPKKEIAGFFGRI